MKSDSISAFFPGFEDKDSLDFVVSFYTLCFLDRIKSNRVAINLAIVVATQFFFFYQSTG